MRGQCCTNNEWSQHPTLLVITAVCLTQWVITTFYIVYDLSHMPYNEWSQHPILWVITATIPHNVWPQQTTLRVHPTQLVITTFHILSDHSIPHREWSHCSSTWVTTESHTINYNFVPHIEWSQCSTPWVITLSHTISDHTAHKMSDQCPTYWVITMSHI